MTEATRRAHTPHMETRPHRQSTGSPLKLDVVVASLLMNVGILVALVTWVTSDRFDTWSVIGNEQVRNAVSVAATGVPVALLAALLGRALAGLPVDLGTGTLLALLASLGALFTTAAVLHALLPWDASDGVQLLHAAINGGTIFFMARILARRARQSPDWISITGTIFAVGLLPLGVLSLAVELVSTTAPTVLAPVAAVHPLHLAGAAIYLATLLPALFFGRALLRAESARYRPLERGYVEALASFGVGSLAAFLVPIAVSRLYDAVQTCTEEYLCVRPPAEWIVIGLLTGATAWRLVRAAQASRQRLLWVGALPPTVTTAVALNWYLPVELGGLPIAGALIAVGGLLLLRRATMSTTPRVWRRTRGR